jgi:hypothetical protein
MSEKYSFECVKIYTSWFFYIKLQLDILQSCYIFQSFLLKWKQINNNKKSSAKTNKRYQNLKNNKQKSENKIQKYTKPDKNHLFPLTRAFIVYVMWLYFINFSLKVYVALKWDYHILFVYSLIVYTNVRCILENLSQYRMYNPVKL